MVSRSCRAHRQSFQDLAPAQWVHSYQESHWTPAAAGHTRRASKISASSVGAQLPEKE